MPPPGPLSEKSSKKSDAFADDSQSSHFVWAKFKAILFPYRRFFFFSLFLPYGVLPYPADEG